MNRLTCCCLGILLLSPAWRAARGEETAPKALEIGDAAPDFKLPAVDGKTYSLKDFAGFKTLVIAFTCNHCPTAQSYEERLKKLAADFKDKGVGLAAISPNDPKAVRLDELGYTDLGDSFEEMKIAARDRGFNFPYLYDGETQEVSRAYGPTSTPHLFIFDAERKLRYRGHIDDSESGKNIQSHDARNAIEALLAGKPVPIEKTRAFGCSIKWADKRGSNEKFLKDLAAEKVTLEDIDAKGLKTLRENKGEKLLLINLWASWCGPCVLEFPDLVTINRMYRNREFEFITISADLPGTRKAALSFLEKQQASSKNYNYSSENREVLGDILDKQWSGSIPLTLLVKPGGKVIFRHEGQIDPMKLRRAILDHLGRAMH